MIATFVILAAFSATIKGLVLIVAGHGSSDGQFFAANRGSGMVNAKYGPDPGLKIYSFLSGQYGSFHSSVIGATAGEALLRTRWPFEQPRQL